MYIMDAEMKKSLEGFAKLCYMRSEAGAKTYGTKYDNADLYKEMSDELADVANYAFMEYHKIQKLKRKRQRLDDENSSS